MTAFSNDKAQVAEMHQAHPKIKVAAADVSDPAAVDSLVDGVNDPDDVAKTVAFLLSEDAATISGASVDVVAVRGAMAVLPPGASQSASGQ